MSMSIYCSFTAVWDICGQLPAVLRVGHVSLKHCNTEVSSALRHVSGAEVMLILGQCQETQQIDQTAFFCPSSCQDAVLLAGKAARMWKQHITINMKLFFTLYILSIFTHKMYMIGMHIIFLLTDSFNKELCQSAAVVSTYLICRWKYYSSSELSPQLKC